MNDERARNFGPVRNATMNQWKGSDADKLRNKQGEARGPQ